MSFLEADHFLPVRTAVGNAPCAVSLTTVDVFVNLPRRRGAACRKPCSHVAPLLLRTSTLSAPTCGDGSDGLSKKDVAGEVVLSDLEDVLEGHRRVHQPQANTWQFGMGGDSLRGVSMFSLWLLPLGSLQVMERTQRFETLVKTDNQPTHRFLF